MTSGRPKDISTNYNDLLSEEEEFNYNREEYLTGNTIKYWDEGLIDLMTEWRWDEEESPDYGDLPIDDEDFEE